MLNRTTFTRRVFQVQEDGNGATLGGLGDNGLLAAADAFGTELAEDYPNQQAEPKKRNRQPEPESEPDTDDVDDFDDDEDEIEADEGEGEDDPDEDETDDDSGEDETEDDPDEDATPEPQKHKVRINGEDVEVTTDELTQGYLRQADYTQKTQALAERNKQFEQQRQELETTRAQYDQRLQQIDDALRSYSMPQQWWDNLYQQDPDRYAEELHKDQQRQRQLEGIKQERERVNGETQQQQAQRAQRELEQQREQMTVLIPEWVDQSRREADVERLTGYGRSIGFTNDEMQAITDARAVKVLNDAARWRQLQDKRGKAKTGEAEAPAKSKKRTQGKKISTGRPRNQNPNQSRSKKAAQSLKKTGSTQAAEAWFLTSGLAD